MTKTPKASDLGKEAMTDVTDLEAITRQFEAAWNAHDMQAFGELFAAEAIFVGRFATRLQGREAIVSAHQKIHETNYRGSNMTVDRPDVDLLTENIGCNRINVVNSKMFGDASPRSELLGYEVSTRKITPGGTLADTLKQGGSGFIVRISRHKFTTEMLWRGN